MAHMAHIFPREVPITPPVLRYVPDTFRNPSGVRILPSNISIFTSQPFRDSSSCPRSHPGLQTNFGHQKIITDNTNRHRTLSVRTLRVRELCRHDRDTSPVNNQYRKLDAHIGSYIFYEDLYRSNRITTYVIPFVIGMLLARDSIVGIIIPSSISLPASLFTRSIILHPATNSLVTLFARLGVMSNTERAQRYLSETRSDKS